jgi:hypothetical protein
MKPNLTEASTKYMDILCELCNDKFADPETFRIHCQKNATHLSLERKFTDETYDFLFND